MRKFALLTLILSAIACISGTVNEKDYEIKAEAYTILHFRMDYGSHFRPVLFSTVMKGDTLVVDNKDLGSFLNSVYGQTRTFYPQGLYGAVNHAYASMFPDRVEAEKNAALFFNEFDEQPWEKTDTVVLETGQRISCRYCKMAGIFYEADSDVYYPYSTGALSEFWKDCIEVSRTVVPVGVIYMDSVPDFRIINNQK